MKKIHFDMAILICSLCFLPLNAIDTSNLLADKGYFPNTGVVPSEIDDESDDNPDQDNAWRNRDNNCNSSSQRETLLRKNPRDPNCPKSNNGYVPEEGDKGYFPDNE